MWVKHETIKKKIKSRLSCTDIKKKCKIETMMVFFNFIQPVVLFKYENILFDHFYNDVTNHYGNNVNPSSDNF